MAGDDARVQVFVSSTYTDLIEERKAVMWALLELGAFPAGMELFPAADDEAWTLIMRVIDESDYYLLVVGGRYGSRDAEGLSYTEKEYNYAVSQGKPVLPVLHGAPGAIAVDRTDMEPDARAALARFRARVEGAKHVKYWTSAADLQGKIAISFNSFRRTYPAVGWVRGDAGDSPETLRRLAASQEQVVRLESALRDRAVEPPTGAEGLADGDDRLTMIGRASTQITNLRRDSGIARKQLLGVTCSLSWNEILAGLGPLLVDEAGQDELRARLNDVLWRVNGDQALDKVAEWLRAEIPLAELAKDEDEPDFAVELSADGDDFEIAMVQLRALGLIQRGQRKRPIADAETYWMLTPWGHTRLTQLRAVRAGATRPPNEADEGVAEGFEDSDE